MLCTESKHVLERHLQPAFATEIERPLADTWEDLVGFASETPEGFTSPNRVLIAHSDEYRRGGLAWHLGAQGFDVVEVEDGGELVDYFDDHGPWLPVPHPDVIVAELDMPGCSGLEAAKQLRRAGVLTPILFINADASPTAAAIATRLVNVRVLRGAVEAAALRAAVEETLRAPQSQSKSAA